MPRYANWKLRRFLKNLGSQFESEVGHHKWLRTLIGRCDQTQNLVVVGPNPTEATICSSTLIGSREHIEGVLVLGSNPRGSTRFMPHYANWKREIP